ncbi:hypothetical protein [Planktothrix sp.]|uniref:hypothetical protein n=1 Tax=Planktothrix sp. TaxID=3088171 RepID=UPI0038D41CB8
MNTEGLQSWIELQTKLITSQLKEMRDVHNKHLSEQEMKLRIRNIKLKGILHRLEHENDV